MKDQRLLHEYLFIVRNVGSGTHRVLIAVRIVVDKVYVKSLEPCFRVGQSHVDHGAVLRVKRQFTFCPRCFSKIPGI